MMDIDFGIQIEPQFGYTYSHIRDIARSAEKHSLESIWTSDHLLIRLEAVDINCLECWTTLSALSTETETLKLGNMVASQSYRNPALHAKIAASLDHISAGRVYFGIGAGWKEVEYNAYNIPFHKPWVRLKQLDEAIEIAKRMWYEPVADYHGKYYCINKTASMPKPIQNPLPIVIGGMGYHLLKITAKHANMANFAWDIPLTKYREKLEVLKKHCNRYNRDYETIRKSAGIYLGLQGAETMEMAPYEKYSGKRQWEYRTPEEAAESIKGYVELGVDHFVIVFPYRAESESIKILMENVVSNV
jgi:alkanesulfonate monooxygenase SsuD/methylene tetrahydromethanopterin reductase-like flavin-dependent oxidoreductase (luciferase family)